MKHHSQHHTHHQEDMPLSYKRKAVFVVIFSAAIAILGIWADQISRELLLSRDQASNYWAYFHQKSIKKRIYESELTSSDTLSTERIHELNTTITRYQEEEKDIQILAEEQEALVKTKLTKLHGVELTIVLFEITIILLSVSLIVPVLWLELIGASLGIIGVIISILTIIQ